MKYSSLLLLTLSVLPSFSYAANDLQTTTKNITTFLNGPFFTFLLGLGFLFFAINAIRFFVAESGNEEGREKAKRLAIYGVFAFVLILVFWGIVNLLASSLGFSKGKALTSDYVDKSSGQTPCATGTETSPNTAPCNTTNPTTKPATTPTGSAGSNSPSNSTNWSGNNYNYSNNNYNNSDKAPKKPTVNNVHDGFSSGLVGNNLSFILQTTDPEKDSLYYQISWSDYPKEITPSDQNLIKNFPTESTRVPSGTPITVSRYWTNPGVYTFQVRAIDTDNNQSKWETHTVTVYESSDTSVDNTQYFDPNTGFLIQLGI